MIDPVITRGLVHKENGVWISPKISDVSYPEEAHRYLFSVEENSFWFQHRNDCIIEILQRFPPKEYIIDVGGGNGYVSLGIQKAGFNVIMLESGPDGVMNAVKRGIKEILHTTFQDADFPYSTVDCIGLFDVLEHIEDDHTFLNVAFRCMRKEGKLYVTVPAHRYLWSLIDTQAGHFRRYSISLLTKLLNRSGFEVIYASYFFSGLSLPIFFFRTLPTFLRLPQNRSHEKKAKIHRKRTGFIGRVLAWHWKHEIRRLKTGKLSHGASLIAVAKPIKS
jgi:SAM-dependent methyltransferase